jgi:hypothetical protein
MQYRKSQSALEFYVNIGWIILMCVIILMSMVYFGVFNLSIFSSDDIQMPTGLKVTNHTVTQDRIYLQIDNSIGKLLYNFTVFLPACNSTKGASSAPTTLQAGENYLEIACRTIKSNRIFTSDIMISYITRSEKVRVDVKHDWKGKFKAKVIET